jgi:hypothetical protein
MSVRIDLLMSRPSRLGSAFLIWFRGRNLLSSRLLLDTEQKMVFFYTQVNESVVI